MISRDDVQTLYRRILDREPESEDVINEKRKSSNISEIAIEMLMSEEFIRNNSTVLQLLVN
jgi:hypothetical protein